MRTIHISLGKRSYDIILEPGILDKTGGLVKRFVSGCKVFIITDDVVEALYGARVKQSLEREGFEVHTLTFPHGEQSKTMQTLNHLVEQMLSLGITRSDRVVALGGGVVGDTAGFAAHVVLRGVPYIQIPTTLLAQVDSSVGGKVAVDVPQGKNLVGAFNQPELVIIDPACLSTLSDEIFADGMAEVIKYGVIRSCPLFEQLSAAGSRAGVMEQIEDVIYQCVDIKRQVVENDELDTGERMILNFGHTVGHVIEKQYNYTTYTHGQAVGSGMWYIARLGEALGESCDGLADTLRTILMQYGIPHNISVSNAALKSVMLDKKSSGKDIRIILADHIGGCHIKRMEQADFLSQMQKLL